MVIKIKWEQQGGYIHCAVFTARRHDLTYAKCGDVVFDEQEWPEVKEKFLKIAVLEERS